MKKELLTISEALSRLALYDRAEALMDRLRDDAAGRADAVAKEPDAEFDDYDLPDSTPEGYGLDRLRKYFDESTPAEEDEPFDAPLDEAGRRLPEVGDIAVLPVKLDSPKEGKRLYLGYERRPVLILKAGGESIDGLGITHSATYLGNGLINIGKVCDSKDSYVNLYTWDKYGGIPTRYEFPLFDVGSSKPMTKAEVGERYFGKMYRKASDDDSEIFLVRFDYTASFVKKLSDDKLKCVVDALEAYRNGGAKEGN